jgi:hypothetical protein
VCRGSTTGVNPGAIDERRFQLGPAPKMDIRPEAISPARFAGRRNAPCETCTRPVRATHEERATGVTLGHGAFDTVFLPEEADRGCHRTGQGRLAKRWKRGAEHCVAVAGATEIKFVHRLFPYHGPV